MRPEPRLLLGSSQLGWVTALTQWVAEQGGAHLVGQALTTADVNESDFDVLVIDGWSSLLSRRLVGDIQRRGAAVMVLVHPDESSTSKLDEVGVRVSLPLGATPEQIVSRAAEVAAVRRAVVPASIGAGSRAIDSSEGVHSKLIAVLGTGDVTDVAVNLAAVVASMGQSVAVVDFDTVEPSIVQRLGLPLIPNLLTAAEAVRSAEFGPSHVSKHSAGFDAIGGLGNPREWDSYSHVEADELAAEIRSRYGLGILVVNRMLEDLAPLSGIEARFDVARRVVGRADEVLLVVPATPLGLTHGLTLIADVRSITQAPIRVAADSAPKAAFQQSEWKRELERSFDPEGVHFLPTDPQVARAAWDGRLPGRSSYMRAVRGMAGVMVKAWAT